MKISLIVPCYNEQEALPIFYRETKKVMESMDCDYEMIFVNDGSKDGTLELLKEFAKEDTHVTYIGFSRNFGKEAAILENQGYDSVATRRATRKGEPVIRSWFARMFYRLINKISDADIVDGARDFRLMKRSMVDAIVEMGEYNRFSKGIFGWIGFKTYWLPYENVNRVAGETKWSFWKLFRYAIDGVINFSQAPLSVASWFGMFMTFVSFIAVVFIIIRKLIFGDPVDGWASTVCIITLIGGIQLFCMGIMGQYIAKTYLEVKKRPHYIVSDTNREDMEKVK